MTDLDWRVNEKKFIRFCKELKLKKEHVEFLMGFLNENFGRVEKLNAKSLGEFMELFLRQLGFLFLFSERGEFDVNGAIALAWRVVDVWRFFSMVFVGLLEKGRCSDESCVL